MDDIILTGDNLIKFEVFKNCFAKLFKIKDLETLRYVLGMKLARSKKGFFLSQRTLDLLKETGLLGCKQFKTPIDPTCKLGLLKE